MYKIIGSDQKEYGPVSSDQIQQWIANGRVNAQTRAQMEGGEWKTIGDFPEFAVALRSRMASMTPPPAGPPPISTAPVKTNGLAIASLILGILGVFSCGSTALVGLILGIVSMGQVRRSKGSMGGGGIALAGTIVSAVFLVFIIPLAAAMLLPALSTAKHRAMAIQCVNNLKQLSLGAHMYAEGHEDHFPATNKWCEDLQQYVGNSTRIYKCPIVISVDGCDYAYNAQVAGLDVKSVNPQTVLFFESQHGWNLSGGPEILVSPPRHRTGPQHQTINVAFADGHIEQVSLSRVSQLRWVP